MSLLLPLLAAYAGLLALALSMSRHHRDILGRPLAPARVRPLRGLGFALLLTALGAAVALEEWSQGPLVWLGVLSVAAGTLTLLIAWRPRLAPAPLAVVIGLLVSLLIAG